MSPDDPRHGTYAGATVHWRERVPLCEPCAIAASRRRKRNKYLESMGRPQTVPAHGVVRRVHALMAIGWSQSLIAEHAGVHIKTMRNPLWRGEGVYRATHEAIAKAYEELCMKLPPDDTAIERRNANYVRNLARRKGWAPPLAWDDIDDPRERPHGHKESKHHGTAFVDEMAVQRVMDGERVPCNQSERREVIRRWRAAGRSLNDLERLQGWNARRDRRKAA